MSILLSAGHNPTSSGACNGDFCENPVATDWINQIYYLILPHIEVEVVPTGSLGAKVRFCNSRKDAKIAVELHFNSNVRAVGSESLYYPNSSSGLLLASRIQTEFKNADIFQPNRGTKEGYHAGGNHKQKKLLYFLAKTSMTSAIIEPEFVYNKDKIIEFRQEGCRAIADALIKHYHAVYDVNLNRVS